MIDSNKATSGEGRNRSLLVFRGSLVVKYRVFYLNAEEGPQTEAQK